MAKEPLASNGVVNEAGFNLATCARPNILALKPYRCARDDYADDGTNILLDANENSYGPGLYFDRDSQPSEKSHTPVNGHPDVGPDRYLTNGHSDPPQAEQTADIQLDLHGLNRYPDPHQTDLKQLICTLRNTNHHTTTPLTPSHLFTGVGSDEAIDLLLRCFCIPRESQLLICPPTYGMYSVAAQVNDTPVVSIPQLLNPFRLDLPAIHAALSAAPQRIRLMYLTSPGNPTGSLISKGAVLSLLQHPTWNGILVVDEAYIDFADPGSSLAQLVTQYPNLVVMQTLSKAFGLAGVRLGFAFAAPEVAALLNAVKAPYNVSSLASAVGRLALRPESVAVMGRHRASIVAQRDRLVQALARVPGLGPVRGGTASNFLLVPVLSGGEEAAMGSDGQGPRPCNEVALACYEALAGTKRVVVRFRGKEYGCEGCLRITVGTEEENDRLLAELPEVLKGICRASGKRDCTKE